LVNLVCNSTAPLPTGAVSRKVHGATGPFDIDLLPLVPVTGASGIEPRQGPVAGEHQIVLNFPSAVTVGGVAVSTGTGSATSSVAGSVVTINLTGVTDVQRIGVTLSSVNDGANLGSVIVPMRMLIGDVNQSGGVSATDISITKSSVGATTPGNFRADAAVNGSINSSDIGLVKSRSGSNLP